MASAQPMTQPSHRGAPVVNNHVGSPPSKEQLRSWWNKFGRRKDKPEEQPPPNHGIFGVPLAQSILYANVAISLTNDQGESFIYGYVPIVVAKCGVFLKEKATDVEGIFRLSGSARRINDLQTVFNSPERYGKGLDWTGYTVHDAANILRRYLNQLPEPIVPLDFYEKFRDPLRDYQAKVGSDTQAEALENQEHARAVAAYQKLITQLPALNRQLLLYILDLLAVFASKSDLNRMPAQNLAAIFQPGIISHPAHDMAPNQYRLSQDVLIFLIENQDNFLIGMTGTAMDQKTQEEVKSGPPSVTTVKNTIGRSASTASAGSVSVRRTGGVRRNASLSSRNSRDRSSPQVSSPGTPISSSTGLASTSNTGSLGRSNTVPSNRSPAMVGGRFQTQRLNDTQQFETQTNNIPGPVPITPVQATHEQAMSSVTPVIAGITAPMAAPGQYSEPRAPSEMTSSTKAPPEMTSSTRPGPAIIETNQTIEEPAASTAASLALRPATESNTPTSSLNGGKPRERKISGLIAKSPIFGPSDVQRDSQRQPRKLQKRRIPGATNESAQSSAASLHADDNAAFHTPLATPSQFHQERNNPIEGFGGPTVADSTQESSSQREGRRTGPTLMPPHSSPTPSQKSRGSATEVSDFEALDDSVVRQNRRAQMTQHEQLEPPPPMGQLTGAKASNSSLGSHRPRKSFTGDSQMTQSSTLDSTGQASAMAVSSRESAEILGVGVPEAEKKNFFSRLKAKVAQSKEQRDAEKERAKSPPRFQGENINSRSSLSAFAHEHLSPRGRSFDKQREGSHSSEQAFGHERTGSRTPVPPLPSAGPAQGQPSTANQAVQAPATSIPQAAPITPPRQAKTTNAAEVQPAPSGVQQQIQNSEVVPPSQTNVDFHSTAQQAPPMSPIQEATGIRPVTVESAEEQRIQQAIQNAQQVKAEGQVQP